MPIGLPFRSVTVLLISVSACLNAAEPAANTPKGWVLTGPAAHAYSARPDSTEKHTGKASALLQSSTPDLDSFGALMQTFSADNYRGRRIRLSGYLRTRDLELWAALWMRVDGPETSSLAFDNMSNRPVRGNTEWSSYQIVLDVPRAAVQIAYGVTLAGSGRLWVDDLSVEAVGEDVATTDMRQPPVPAKIGVPVGLPSTPTNTGFEE